MKNTYQCKIFYGVQFKDEDNTKAEQTINTWLSTKANIEIVHVAVAPCGGERKYSLMVFYREIAQ